MTNILIVNLLRRRNASYAFPPLPSPNSHVLHTLGEVEFKQQNKMPSLSSQSSVMFTKLQVNNPTVQ